MSALHEMSDFTVDPFQLLELVRKYRCIYDKSCFDFKNQEKKAAAWEVIAAEMNCDNANLLRKKYLSIRTTLGRYFKKQTILGKDAVEVIPEYEKMRWIKTYIHERCRRYMKYPKEKSSAGSEEYDDDDDNNVIDVNHPTSLFEYEALAAGLFYPHSCISWFNIHSCHQCKIFHSLISYYQTKIFNPYIILQEAFSTSLHIQFSLNRSKCFTTNFCSWIPQQYQSY